MPPRPVPRTDAFLKLNFELVAGTTRFEPAALEQGELCLTDDGLPHGGCLMSRPEAPKPEAHVETHVDTYVDTHVATDAATPVEPVHEESPGLTQREFLKKLVGSAAGFAGLAAAGTLLTPKTAEAAYTTGGAPYAFPTPVTTGDQITTNVHVNGHLQVKGYRPWIDVTAFGAPGDWSAFADGAVAAAIAAVPAQGGILYFPPGVYAFNGPIAINGKYVTIAGAGRLATYLFFWTGGIDVTNSLVAIRDMAITGGSVNTSSAIRITGGWTGGVPTTQPHIENVWILPGTAGSAWNKGIELIGAAGGKIERFEINCGGNGATHGIHLRQASAITNVASGVISGAGIGIQASDQYTEGCYFRGIEVLDGNIGYYLSSPGPGTAISDCHANTAQNGIRLYDHGDMALMGNLLYGYGEGYVGIHLDGSGSPHPVYGSHKVRIIGNQITRFGSGTGIHLQGYSSDCIIQGNVVEGAATGISLNGANVANCVAVNNRLKVTGTPVFNTGVANTTVPNY
jgi:hypothetical protein